MRYLSKRYFECRNSKSNKFWEIIVGHYWYQVRYGKVGTRGTPGTKSRDNIRHEVSNNLITSKIRKGYIEVTRNKLTLVVPKPKQSPKSFNRLMSLIS